MYRDPDAGKVPLIDAVNDWLLSRRSSLAPSTWRLYATVADNHVCHGFERTNIGELTPAAIRSWLGRLDKDGVGRPTIIVARQVMSQVLDQAVADGRIPANPVLGSPRPRRERPDEPKVLVPEDVEAIAAAIDERYRAFVYLLAYGGLRVSEALGLRWKRIDLLRRRVEVREQLSEAAGLRLVRLKTRASQRTVALGPSVADELAQHAERFGPADPEGFVFTSPTGGPIRLGNRRRRSWAPAVHAAGLEGVRVHDLRHFAARVAIAAGAHPKQVQGRLGHSNITTTLDRYGHLFPTLDADLADRIDANRRGGDVRRIETGA